MPPVNTAGPPGNRGASRWAGLVFGGLGFGMFILGLGLGADRLVVFHTWPEVEARVIESRVVTKGSQHSAYIRVEFDLPGRKVATRPASDYRSGDYGWIAETVDRFPVGSTAPVRYNPRDPQKARVEVGFNFNTLGTPLLLLGVGLVFWGVGVLAARSARLAGAEASARNRAEAARLARNQYRGVAGFVGVIGLASLGAGVALLRPALAEREWPVVTARVERTDIFTRSAAAKKHSPTALYVGRVFVAYEFGGKSYQTAYPLRNASSDRAKTERMLAAIRPGDPRAVRVNPANPYQAEAADSWPLVLPGVFLFTGLVITGVAGLVLRSAPKVPAAA